VEKREEVTEFMSQTNYNNIDSPPRHCNTVVTTHKRHAVTSNLGNSTIKHIKFTKKIVDYFSRRAREDPQMANEMIQAIREAEEQ
jgi:hypothetical protein